MLGQLLQQVQLQVLCHGVNMRGAAHMCQRTWANGFYPDASRCDSSPAALLYLKVGFSLEFGSVQGSGQFRDLRSSFNPAVEDDGNYCKKKKTHMVQVQQAGTGLERKGRLPPLPHTCCAALTYLL